MAQDQSLKPSPLSPYALDPSYLPRGPEFIFPVEVRQRSWNEKMFERTGTCYVSGLTIGGAWGLAEGLRRPEGSTMRLRLNSVLNGCTRRGPFLANTGAVLALMYSPLESSLANLRGKEDNFNSILAASITGVIYKSTVGLRPMALAGLAGCGVIGAYTVAAYFLGRERLLFY